MEFGKVPRVEEVDFTLPPDDGMTRELLKSLVKGKDEPLRIHVGCTQWGNKEWIGKIYPKGTKDKDFLAAYVKQFNCIELNTLFYNLQPRSVIERWASVAGEGFRFCPKFSNTISHTRQLKNVQQETGLFIDHVQSFGPTLGYSFLQLSDGFGPDRADVLLDYVRQLPRDFRSCVELRHENWYSGATSAAARAGEKMTGKGVHQSAGGNLNHPHRASASQTVWDTFRELGVGTVITDTAGRRDCLHMKMTAPVAFIRFVANNLHPTDFPRIDAWADRLKTWIDGGLREIYFFMHSSHELYAPDLVRYAVEQFNKTFDAGLKPPKLLNEDQPKNLTLF
ncbi:MAG TPA: DUF72 domain-containing protein [Puia sp.]|nr:DUF72 domain-containing protein [Puia sp.]